MKTFFAGASLLQKGMIAGGLIVVTLVFSVSAAMAGVFEEPTPFFTPSEPSQEGVDDTVELDGTAELQNSFDVSEPSESMPSVAEPSESMPSVSEPSESIPSVAEPSESMPSVSEPSVSEPSISEPSVSEPSVSEPSVSEPSVSEPSASIPSSSGD